MGKAKHRFKINHDGPGKLWGSCGEVARKCPPRIADADWEQLGKSTPFLDQFGEQNEPNMIKNEPKRGIKNYKKGDLGGGSGGALGGAPGELRGSSGETRANCGSGYWRKAKSKDP